MSRFVTLFAPKRLQPLCPSIAPSASTGAWQETSCLLLTGQTLEVMETYALFSSSESTDRSGVTWQEVLLSSICPTGQATDRISKHLFFNPSQVQITCSFSELLLKMFFSVPIDSKLFFFWKILTFPFSRCHWNFEDIYIQFKVKLRHSGASSPFMWVSGSELEVLSLYRTTTKAESSSFEILTEKKARKMIAVKVNKELKKVLRWFSQKHQQSR